MKKETNLLHNCNKLIGDILMHMSEEARIISSQRTEKFKEIESKKDIIKLCEAIEESLGSNGQQNKSVFSFLNNKMINKIVKHVSN